MDACRQGAKSFSLIVYLVLIMYPFKSKLHGKHLLGFGESKRAIKYFKKGIQKQLGKRTEHAKPAAHCEDFNFDYLRVLRSGEKK